MKVVTVVVSVVEFDLTQERERIRSLFKRKKEERYRNALLAVIDAFEKGGLDLATKAYDRLPRHKEEEYPLQESMGKWWWQIHGNQFMYEDNVWTTTTTSIHK